MNIWRDMADLLGKLNYKGQDRIAIINAGDDFISSIAGMTENVTIDREIDPRFPYSFIIIFVKTKPEVEHYGPAALHNLTADGIMWFCYPKKTSPLYSPGLDRDHGWNILNDSGFHGIRMVSIDDDWSAIRFRNIKYIKSTSGRFPR